MKNIKIEERFKLLCRLGKRGGSGEVWKVEDKDTNNELCALKIAHKTLEEDPESKQEFFAEVQYLKALNHNNIVKIKEELLIEGKAAILMELVEGESLQDIVDANKYITVTEILEIVKQVSAGLLACHYGQIPKTGQGLESKTQLFNKHAITHNDLHPKNIIKVTQNGESQYKLIDFGLSFVNPENVTERHIKNGLAEYKAPEKWLMNTIDTRVDVYSFGVLVFWLLAGRVPFVANDYTDPRQMAQLKEHHLHSPLPNIWDLRKELIQEATGITPEKPDYPYWLQQMVEKCLEKDPLNRFRTGEDINQNYFDGVKGRLKNEWTLKEDKEEEEAWLLAYQTNTPESLQQFIKSYPNSKYIVRAKEELSYVLEKARKKQAEETSWNLCIEHNELERYQKFVKEYPRSKYLTIAHEQIAKLNTIENNTQKEEQDWQQAQNTNTKKGYKNFLENYPNSKYKPYANAALIKLNEKSNTNKNKWLAKLKKAGMITVVAVTCFILFYTLKDTVSNWLKSKPKTEIPQTFNEKEHTNWITKFYKAQYFDVNFTNNLDKYITFPLQFSGKKIDENIYKKIMYSTKLIQEKLNKSNATIKQKTIEVDSIIYTNKKEPIQVKVYAKAYVYKQKKGFKAVKKELKTIIEELTISNGKIVAIKNIKKE